MRFPITMGGGRASVCYGAMAAWVLPSGGGHLHGASMGSPTTATGGAMGGGGDLERS